MAHRWVLQGPEQLSWSEQALPELRLGFARLRTLKTAVSVSSTLSEYLGQQPHLSFPRNAGYESLAVVEETTDPAALPVGTRVVDTYGHADTVVRPIHKLVPVPEGISDEVALLVVLACDAFRGVYRLRPRPKERVLVMGCGVMGLLACWNLLQLGVQVDVHDPLPERMDLATRLGATAVEKLDLSTLVYPCALECSAAPEAFEDLQSVMQPGGRICVLSDGNWGRLVLSPAFHHKELTIVASSDGLDYRQYGRVFFRQVRPQQRLLAELYDTHLQAAELSSLFAEMAGGLRPCKVLVHW